jgi:O-antigen/teichoic acid export membrane protein
MSITQPNFGYFNISGGLIIGDLFGKIISGFVLINKFIKNDKEQIKNINKLVVFEQMKKYKDFPIVNSLHAFSDVIRTSGSIMLISSFFGSTILGFYALSLRVLQAPVGIIGSALGQVLYKKFTYMYNYNEDLSPYVKKIIFILFFIAVPSFGTLYYIAPDLFAFIFGEKWRIAGEYSQYLTPYLFINFIVSPISSLPIILNKQKEFFYFSLAGNIGMPLLLFISYKLNYDLKEALVLITIYMTSLHIFILSWTFSIIKKKKQKESI